MLTILPYDKKEKKKFNDSKIKKKNHKISHDQYSILFPRVKKLVNINRLSNDKHVVSIETFAQCCKHHAVKFPNSL